MHKLNQRDSACVVDIYSGERDCAASQANVGSAHTWALHRSNLSQYKFNSKEYFIKYKARICVYSNF